MQVRIVKLSTVGALLHGHLLEFLPEQFYLCLGEKEIFITCAKRQLKDNKMAVVFAQPESPGFCAGTGSRANANQHLEAFTETPQPVHRSAHHLSPSRLNRPPLGGLSAVFTAACENMI